MTRTLFFLTALVGMLFALTAVFVRYELAYPGVSPLFQTTAGTPDGQMFNTVSIMHKFTGFFAVMLLGTTMISAARDKDAPFGRFFLTLAGVICAVTAAGLLLAVFPLNDRAEIRSTGWVLYPPLTAYQNPTYLTQLLKAGTLPSALPLYAASLLLALATSLLYLGAYVMLSVQNSFRLSGLVGFFAVLLVSLPYFTVMGGTDINTPIVYFPMLALPFVGMASIRLVDAAPPWLLLLTLGTLTALVTTAGVVIAFNQDAALNGTMAEAALHYMFPLGLAWYAMPALILFRQNSTMPPLSVLGLFGGLTVGLAAWITPLVMLGRRGQLTLYVDYPDPFAGANLHATTAAFVFVPLYLAVIIIARRSRAV